MNLNELKQEKQKLESRLFQILSTQKYLGLEYQTLEKQLNKILGKIELLEEDTILISPESKVTPQDTPQVTPQDTEVGTEEVTEVVNRGIRSYINMEDLPVSPEPCKISGASFF